jgi:hypothetical protein
MYTQECLHEALLIPFAGLVPGMYTQDCLHEALLIPLCRTGTGHVRLGVSS